MAQGGAESIGLQYGERCLDVEAKVYVEGSYVTQPEAMVLAAGLGAFISLIVSLIGYVGSRRAQREIELLKGDLAERKSDRDARRDYEYEARKRLYQECEPVLFQMYEASENGLHRILSLARTSRKGGLEPEDSWLGEPNYYFKSTLYNLLAPVALFKLVQRRLTFVDMAVEPRIRSQYNLMKLLYLTFSDHFTIAGLSPPLPYDGNNSQQYKRREVDPAQYWRQGVPLGILDVAAECLFEREASGILRLKSFGEFETEFSEEGTHSSVGIGHFGDLFIRFHPRARPVLWRLLIVQAHIYRALLEDGQDRHRGDSLLLRSIPKAERRAFDWRREKEDAPDQKVLDEPFAVAEEYLRTYIPKQYVGE